MQYVSTRGAAPKLGFEEAMLAGLARDGGLYVPETWPRMSEAEIAALAGLSYEEAAFRVMRPFIGGAFADDELRGIIGRAYAGFRHAARVPLRQVGANDWLLELFHGPTLAFKDVAMQLIGELFEASLQTLGPADHHRRRDERRHRLGGDRGLPGARGGRGLHPLPRGAGVGGAAAADDDAGRGERACAGHRRATSTTRKARLKDLFNDHAFRDGVGLAGVNSINWARVLAQTVYYFTAAVALGAPHRPVSFTVPTGNFGDIFAGWVARRMGLPIERLVIATNQNDILHRTLETGAHRRAGVVPSISPSMDIEVSSNFERLLFELYDREGGAVAALMGELRRAGGSPCRRGRWRGSGPSSTARGPRRRRPGRRSRRPGGPRASSSARIRPSGSTRRGARRGDPRVPMVVLATAHAAKFPDAVAAATGVRPALPAWMGDLMTRPERITRVANDAEAIKDLIGRETVGGGR